jgi:HK97 family phage major capsid protein
MRQMLRGDGTGQNLTGIRNASGVNVTSLGANGATPTLDDVLKMLDRLRQSNAGARPVYFMSARTLCTLQRIRDSQGQYLLQPDPASDVRLQLGGAPILVAPVIPDNLTVGTSTDTSEVILCDLDQVVVGQRMSLELQYSEDYAFASFQVAARAICRHDVKVINAGGVEVLTGVRP